MSVDDLTPAQLNSQLMDLSHEVGKAVNEVRQRSLQYADADRAYKRAYAEAYLDASGTIAERERTADLESLEARYALKGAEGLMRSADLALRAKMAQLNALQSVASSVRQEHRWGQTGPEQ